MKTDHRARAVPGLPDIGGWTRQLRTGRGLTRPAAAEQLHVGVASLKNLETNRGAPSQYLLERLVDGYNLSVAQARHTHELALPPTTLASLPELRARLDSPARRARLARYDQRGIAFAYLDPLWYVIAANEHFHRAVPGVDQHQHNLARWHFSDDPAARIFVHPDQASAFFVATLRTAIGRHRASPRCVDLIRHLSRIPAFSAIWTAGLAAAYGHSPADLLHLRDTHSGETYCAAVHVGYDACVPAVRHCLAIRQP
ncbi:helix-turn-helix domain-containing protein [Nocardia sp. NPDC004068]|uniref:helix-turn-helix domain-containing protein n=1 Tax=Nocardia sp. NPDC004068 TaxID=3364303 RepID=UPI0036A28928